MGTHSIRPSILSLSLFAGILTNVLVDTQLMGQVLPAAPIALTNLTVIDDGDTGFFDSKTPPINYPTAYKADFRFLPKIGDKKIPLATSSWTFPIAKPGSYFVYATWIAFGNSSKDVQYTFTSYSKGVPTILGKLELDQTTKPTDGTFDNASWKKLVKLNLTGDTLQISTNGASDQVTILDGMALQPAAADIVTLQSITISGTQAVVNYTKNFDTCAHLLTADGHIVHTNNSFCLNAGPATVPLSQFNSLFVAGKPYKLCNGNNYNECSDLVTPVRSADTSSASSASSRIVTQSSSSAPEVVTLTSINVVKGMVTVNYTKNFRNCAQILTAGDTKVVANTLIFCPDSGPITIPVFQLNALFAIGHQYRLCDAYNYAVCSALVTATTPVACNDAIDNDSDGLIDFPADPGCTSATDTDEFNPVVASSSSAQSSSAYSVISESFSSSFHSSAQSSSVSSMRIAQLSVSVQNIGSHNTAVNHQKDINLFRFQAYATQDDTLVTGATFTADNGNVQNLQNYTLWVDTNNDNVVDTILQTGVSASGGLVRFDGLLGGGQTIQIVHGKIFEVHADVSSLTTFSSVRLAFATTLPNYIVAKRVGGTVNYQGIKTDGVCAPAGCEINVTTALSMLWSFDPQGSLFVTRDQQPRSRQLLAGALNDEILRLQFRAQNEDVDVTNLQFNSSGSLADSIDRLELYKLGETTPFAVATTGGCGADDVLTTNPGNKNAPIATFCASMQTQQLVIPDGINQIVSIRPRLKSDEQGAVSNQVLQIWVSKRTTTVRARGVQSSNNLDANDDNTLDSGEVFIGVDATAPNKDMVGPVNRSVLAKFTSILNANPDADGTSVPTGVAGFGRFAFTAAENTNTLNGLNKATLSGVVFNVNAMNVNLDASGFKFYNLNDSSSKQNCTVYGFSGNKITRYASGSLLVDCKDLKNSVVSTRIPSGSTTTFVLEGNILNSKTGVTASALQASIQNFATLSNTYGASMSLSHVNWIDEDTNQTFFKWIENGDTTVRSTNYQS